MFKKTHNITHHIDIWVAKINKRNWICFCSDFLILGVKGIQWLNNYFCVQFNDTILNIIVFVKKKNYLIFPFLLEFLQSKNKTCGSVQNPSLLYQESVMALIEVCHGSARSPSWLCKKSVMALR